MIYFQTLDFLLLFFFVAGCIKDIESLLKAYDDETLNEFDGTTADAQ